MTDEQIEQNADAYADVFGRHMVDYYGVKDAFTAGAHSRDEEIEQLRNPWISVEERLPEKAKGLYELEKDEQYKMVLLKTANGKNYIGYLDAEEIWRAFTVPYKGACPIDSLTWAKVTHWMPIQRIKEENPWVQTSDICGTEIFAADME